MKKHPIIIAAATFIIVLIISGVISMLVSRDYTLRINMGTEECVGELQVEADSFVDVRSVQRYEHYSEIQLHALNRGRGMISVSFSCVGSDGQIIARTDGMSLVVNPVKMLFVGDETSNYTGLAVSYYGIALYAGLMLVYFLWLKRQRLKENYYSYKTITSWASVLFFAVSFLAYFICSVIVTIWFKELDIKVMTLLTGNIMMLLTLIFTPFVITFAISMAHSNISLMLNEGRKIRNMYGIFAGILLLVGTAIVMFLFYLNYMYGRVNYFIAIIFTICSAFFSVFQFMLAASIITGLSAAYRKVGFDKDYIIILGCAIKKDGTLYPLIRGRVDRAIRFWKEQYEATGKKAIFIPSGGKGSDEMLSEARAMANYLLEQGIPEEYIIPEINSKTTLENMRFSKEIVDANNPRARVVYSTTNFHVFRSGIFASTVGLDAEGIGSRTKWYFWPNALLRELLGIYAVQPRIQLLLLLIIAVLAGLSGFVYYLIV